ncbi:MAG TPA: UDP-N-acetylglucosamine--N-acetylmuramyl-(pentapeptide) pyrophosphoryl-undecaprenol N-acetylglucosamine transferase, partial [Abditibacteriaceae bacterium]|nr:UDP-N-acetylglucosamine--N-acetylmuramyl-(pentapeptide) pyrophosphoryl-undecaprenol N-acetylglucosamine transferase [Abditibacteriaceae bacterium]
GLEQTQAEAAGLRFVGVETGKLRRYLSRENFSDALRFPVGVWQSRREVKKFAPDVVLATGGYVAVPPVIAAWMARVPILIHEQTVQIGLANRINSRFATKIALSFEEAMNELPLKYRSKAFVAGNPVRPQVFDGQAERAKRFAGFADEDDALPTIYVTGGSQGARVINRAVERILDSLLEHCCIIHQCGQQPAGSEQDFDRLEKAAASLPPVLRRRYLVQHFIRQEINDVFALADLVVSRAGASTINEVCALGKAALYVPLVPTGGDEQTRNAALCERQGAAVSMEQSELASENGANLLRDRVLDLLSDCEHLAQMASAAKTLAKPDAARMMAEAVVELGLTNAKIRR